MRDYWYYSASNPDSRAFPYVADAPALSIPNPTHTNLNMIS